MAQNTKRTASADGIGSASDPWSFSITADGYVVPHSEFFVSPIFTGDRNRLHLEARYNYENQQTGSLWIGYNLSIGHSVMLEITPMIGGVFGNTTGIAPGYEVSLSYKKLSLSSSGEYVFDTKKPSDSFFYSWPELTYSPADWFRLGLVAQRTKTYHTSLDTQRGFLVVSLTKICTSRPIYSMRVGRNPPSSLKQDWTSRSRARALLVPVQHSRRGFVKEAEGSLGIPAVTMRFSVLRIIPHILLLPIRD
jgi:hypothetical protein